MANIDRGRDKILVKPTAPLAGASHFSYAGISLAPGFTRVLLTPHGFSRFQRLQDSSADKIREKPLKGPCSQATKAISCFLGIQPDMMKTTSLITLIATL